MKITAGIVFQEREGPLPIVGNGIDIRLCVNATSESPWRGFASNHNALMETSHDSDWYIAVNPDVRCSCSDLIAMIRYGAQHDYSVIGPSLISPWGRSGGPQRNLPGPATWLRESVLGARQRHILEDDPEGKPVPSAWVSGACMAIRLADKLKFDERFFLYFEDVDLCARARKLGLNVGVCSAIEVSHASGWRHEDPLVMRRGIEFARSALCFANIYNMSPGLMRGAGIVRFGSRALVPRRTPTEQIAARAIAQGFRFLRSREGLSELAAAHNQRIG